MTRADILEFDGDINPNVTIPNNKAILIISKDQSYVSHGIHKFPAKFFPELPRYLIKKYSQRGMIVLDPMCGSGTVLLESMLANRIGIGLDIDPISHLITQAKTTILSQNKLNAAAEALRNSVNAKTKKVGYSPPIPSFHYRDNWFRDFVLYELGTIVDSINEISSQLAFGPEIKNYLLATFSSIIRDVSNADPHCTRTVIRKNQLRRIHPGDTIELFFTKLDSNADSMVSLLDVCSRNEIGQSQNCLATATHIPFSQESIDLAITSPPYINAVDYTRTHQLEMYWLGMLGDNPLSETKRKYIGTETVYKHEYEDLRITGYESLDPIVRSIHKEDPRRSYIVYKFFIDMTSQLSSTYRVLKPGARYCIAIGNNTIRGHEIPSHVILEEIATSEEIGFKLDRKFFSLLIRHFIKIPRPERMEGEWVLIFQKPF